MKDERIYADFRQAAALLRDNQLVWSADFDDIRKDLANLIDANSKWGVRNSPHLIELVQKLIATENDLSI